MKILWVSEFPPDKGGIGDYSYNLVQRLAAEGYKIDIVSTTENSPEILHENANIVAQIPDSKSGWQCIFSDDYDVINVQFPGVRAKGMTLYRFFNSIPTNSLLTVHEVPERLRFIPLLSLFYNFAFLSDYGENIFQKSHPLFSKLNRHETFSFPYQGVDSNLERKLEEKEFEIDLDSNKINIVCPGFIVERKNYDKVIDSFDYIDKDVQLILAGGKHKSSSEKYIDKIRSKADKRNDVKVTGVLESEMIVYEYIRKADIIVLPYEKIFQSGILARSLALGKKTIVSPIPGMRDPVEKYGGIILDEISPESIAEQIEYGLENEVSVDKESVISDMSWERNVERHIEIFEKITN